jgi:hypothetical protein
LKRVTTEYKSEGKAGLLTKQEETIHFEAATALNHEIAKHCLTKIKRSIT